MLNSGAAVETTNLIRHAFWVPLVLRIAERSSSHVIHQAELGATEAWAIAAPVSREGEWSMEGPQHWGSAEAESAAKWLPEVRELGQRARINLTGVPFKTGHYTLMNGAAAIAAIGLNQDRAESDPPRLGRDGIRRRLECPAVATHAHPRGNKFYSASNHSTHGARRPLVEGVAPHSCSGACC